MEEAGVDGADRLLDADDVRAGDLEVRCTSERSPGDLNCRRTRRRGGCHCPERLPSHGVRHVARGAPTEAGVAREASSRAPLEAADRHRGVEGSTLGEPRQHGHHAALTPFRHPRGSPYPRTANQILGTRFSERNTRLTHANGADALPCVAQVMPVEAAQGPLSET